MARGPKARLWIGVGRVWRVRVRLDAAVGGEIGEEALETAHWQAVVGSPDLFYMTG